MHDQKLWIQGPVGRLEALFRPAAEPTRAVALLLHPHPLFGGTMHNKTLFRLARELSTNLHVPSLRFNFRGAGESEGEHDGQFGEIDDARAALNWLKQRLPERPIHVIGYSFGAAVGLRGLIEDPAVASRTALGLPIRMDFPLDWFRTSPLPGLCVQGEHDEFGDCEALRRWLGASAVELACVTGSDHLFTGHEDGAVRRVVEYIARTLSADPS